MTKYSTNPCSEISRPITVETFSHKDIERVLIEQQINIRKMEWDLQHQMHAKAAMDRFFAGAPYEEVLELVKERYPEKFI